MNIVRLRSFTSRSTVPALSAGLASDGDQMYLCDERAHMLDVVDAAMRPLFSFGGRGTKPGQFESPQDVVVAQIHHPADAPEVMVVADTGNDRLQVFERDGSLVATIDGRRGERCAQALPARVGFPHFRLDSAIPLFTAPSRLKWRAPHVLVQCRGGNTVQLDLAVAILPEFSDWLRSAPDAEIREALNLFATLPRCGDVPDACLAQMVERVQPFNEMWQHACERGCA